MRLRKVILIGLGFIIASSCPGQKKSLEGRVSLHNSKIKTQSSKVIYIDNAFISAYAAGQVRSDVNGYYKLLFKGVETGTPVDIKVEKYGYEVVNDSDLKGVTVGRKVPIDIYLSEPGEIDKRRAELYKINLKSITKEYEQKIALLQTENEESKAYLAQLRQANKQIVRYDQAIEFLSKELGQVKDRLPHVVQQLATENLDFANTLYVQAYALIEKGKIIEALQLLDEAKLDESIAATLIRIEEGQKMEAIGKDIQNKGYAQVDTSIKTLTLKAELHTLAFEFKKAAETYETVAQTLKNPLVADSLQLLVVLDQLCESYTSLGNYSKSLETAKEIVSIAEQLYDDNAPELCRPYKTLALVMQYNGTYEAALEYGLKAIRISQQHEDIDKNLLLSIYKNVSKNYQQLSDLEHALEYAEQSLKMLNTFDDIDTMVINWVYDNAGQVYWASGDYEKALQCFQYCIELYRDIQNTIKADNYNNLGLVYVALADYKKALSAYLKALEINSNILGKVHPETGVTHSSLISCYMSLGEYDKALVHGELAIDIFKERLGDKHDYLANAYSDLALLYIRMGQPSKALPYQLKEVDITEAILDSNHIYLSVSYNSLSTIYADLGLDSLALVYCLKAIPIVEANLGLDHPNTATVYINTSKTFRKVGQIDQAIVYSKKARQIFLDNFGKDHPYYAMACISIAEGYHDKKEPLNALPYYLETISVLGDKPQNDILLNTSLSLSCGRAAQIYLSQGDHQKARDIVEQGIQLQPKGEVGKVMATGFLHEVKASILFRDKNADEAYSSITKAISIYENAPFQDSSQILLARELRDAIHQALPEDSDHLTNTWKGNQEDRIAIKMRLGRYHVIKATSLRAASTHQSDVIVRLREGTSVSVLEYTNEYWWKVDYEGRIGWVKNLLLEPVSP